MLVKIKILAHIVHADIIKIEIVKDHALNVLRELTRKKKEVKLFKLAFQFAVLELIHQPVLCHVSNVQEIHLLPNHPLPDLKIVKHVLPTLTHSNLQPLENITVDQNALLELTHQLVSLHAHHALIISTNKCQA
jgi:hypothetical protein